MFLCEILTEQQQAPPQVALAKAGNAPQVVQQVQNPQPAQAAYPAQQNPYQQDYGDMEYDSELDGDEDGGMVAEQPPPFREILPLKKYYLIERLKNLKSRLDEFNIKNTDLEIILKFMNNISYNSLVSLFINILPVIEEQLARLQNNDEV
jgi:hypothetical protein